MSHHADSAKAPARTASAARFGRPRRPLSSTSVAPSTSSSTGPSDRESASATPPAASASHAPRRWMCRPAAMKQMLPAISVPDALRIVAQ